MRRVDNYINDLSLTEQWMENMDNVVSSQDWTTNSEARLEQLKPKSDDIPQLAKEIENFRVSTCDYGF